MNNHNPDEHAVRARWKELIGKPFDYLDCWKCHRAIPAGEAHVQKGETADLHRLFHPQCCPHHGENHAL